MEKTYMKYMKQGSGADYEVKKGPEKIKKAPVPGWITYDMNEAMPLEMKKTQQKWMLQRCNAAKKHIQILLKDIQNMDSSGVVASAMAIKDMMEMIIDSAKGL